MTLNSVRSFSFAIFPLPFLLLFAAGCEDGPVGVDYSDVPPPFDLSQADTSYTTSGGMEIFVIDPGSGPFQVVSRDVVGVFYTGRNSDGRIFDSSYANGNTAPRTLRNLTPVPRLIGNESVGTLIEGFRIGLIGMRESEKRTLIIPPSMAYGDAEEGDTGYEFRNDTLRFDIELFQIF